MLSRLLYLGYYFRKLDWLALKHYMAFVSTKESIPKPILWLNMITHSLKYNISLLEYFQFGFYKKAHQEKLQWAGTGYMYEYQLVMNPRNYRFILEDKIEFLKHYQPFIKRRFGDLQTLKDDPRKTHQLLNNPTGLIIAKKSRGQVGKQVEVYPTKNLDSHSLFQKMQVNGYDLVEEYIIQHPSLGELSPAGVNTVRIITQLDRNGRVHFLGARLRISVNSHVDNLGAGNLAAPINMETGAVDAPAVYSDISKGEETFHPVSGLKIVGFQIPFWKEVRLYTEKLAMWHPQNKSVGWDIAITSTGPEVIEGNHNWCKLLWQLPVKKGLKPLLKVYFPHQTPS